MLADRLQILEQAEAVGAATRSQLLEAFDAQDGSVYDGQRTVRTWLVNVTRVTRGQAHEHKAVQALAQGHQHLLAALAEGDVISTSVALPALARWPTAVTALAVGAVGLSRRGQPVAKCCWA